MSRRFGRAHSPPCITARRGGCVINKMSRSHRNRRRRGGFLLCSQSENHPGLAVADAARHFIDCSATPPCGDARRGICRAHTFRYFFHTFIGRAYSVAIFLLFASNLFGQAAVGNERFEQKDYKAAADAYEKIPSAMRDATTLNRLGISYHLLNRLRPAENTYKAATSKDPRNATFLNNLAALYYSQGKFSDADKIGRASCRERV